MKKALEASRGSLWMVTSAALVALTGELIRVLGTRCDWRVATAGRALLGFLFALAIARASGVKLVANGPPAMWARSLSGTAGMFCNYYAFSHLPTGTALELTASYPIWLTLFSGVMVRRFPAWSTWVGVLLGGAGIALVQRGELGGSAMGVAAALAAAVFAAISMLSIARSGGVDPRAIVVHYSATTAIVALLWVAIAALVGVPVDARGLLGAWPLAAMFAIALLGTLGQFALTRAYSLGPARLMAVLSNTRVAFAVGLDWVLFGLAPQAATAAGVGLIVVPAAWLAYRSGRRISGAADPTVAAAIAAAERQTSCEFRVALDPDAPAAGLDGRARAAFDELGMTATAARNGVLVYIAQGARRVVLVGDVGVTAALEGAAVQGIARQASDVLEVGDRARAAVLALELLAEALAPAFPWAEGDTNELPDEVHLVDPV